jgi:hypothetical protein
MDKENGNRKNKVETRYQKSINGKVKEQKEKRKREELPEEK